MASRQQGVKVKIKQAFQELLEENAPNLSLPGNIDVFVDKLSKAITEVYDSRLDPVVQAYIVATATTFGSQIATGMVARPVGTYYTFFHNLGYEPQVTVVTGGGALWWNITAITNTSVTLYHDHPTGNTGLYRVICS